MADLNMSATMDNGDFLRHMEEIRQSISKVSQQVQEQNALLQGSFERVKGSVLNLAAQFGIGFSAVGFVKQVANVRGEFQKLESSFTTLLGSETKANDLMNQLTRTAAITPFDLQGVAGAAKQLLAYGTAADQVNDKIMQLGNIAAGMNLDMGYMSMLYGTTASKDFMDTMDLKQHKGQGIPIEEAIANVMGIEKKDVAEAVSRRQVSSEVYTKAIEQMAGSGGKFDGMMENQSKTIAGQISNIEDAVDTMFNNIGKDTEGIISDVLSGATWVVENYQKVAEAIGAVAAAYGLYKAALATTVAVHESAASQEIEILQQLYEEEGKAYGDDSLQKLVEKGQLSEESASKLAELREKTEEMTKSLKGEIDGYKATGKELNANIKYQKEYIASETQNIAALKQQEAQLRKTGNTRKADALAKQIDTRQTELNSEAQALNELKTRRLANTRALNAAKTKMSAISTAQDTIATQTNNKVKTAAAMVGKQLTQVFQGLKAAVVSNPLGAIAAAVTALGYAIYKITTYKTAWEETQEKIGKTMNDGTAAASAEIVQLKGLSDNLSAAKKKMDAAKEAQDKSTDATKKQTDATNEVNDATKEYNRLKNDLISQFGDYLKGHEDEIDKLVTENKLYTELSASIMKYHMSKKKSEAMSEATQLYTESTTESFQEADEVIQDARKEALSKAGKSASKEELDKINAKYDRMQQEVKTAIMNGTLREGKDGRLESMVDGVNQISKETSDALLRLVTISRGPGDIIQYQVSRLSGVANDVKNSSTAFKDAREEVDRMYDAAFLDNGIDKNGGLGEAEAKKITDSQYLKKLREKIQKQAEEYQQALADVRAGKMYTPAGSDKSVEMDADYVKAKKEKLDKLIKDWETATGEAFNGTAASLLTKWDLKAYNKALQQLYANQDETQRKEAEAAMKDARDTAIATEQYEINLMADGQAKRTRQRELDHQKTLMAIRDEGEERKEQIIEAAKKEFDAQEEINETRAKLNKQQYERKTFDRYAFVQSQTNPDGSYVQGSQFDLAQQEVETKIKQAEMTRQNAKRKQYQDDIKANKDYWNNLLQAYTAYEQAVQATATADNPYEGLSAQQQDKLSADYVNTMNNQANLDVQVAAMQLKDALAQMGITTDDNALTQGMADFASQLIWTGAVEPLQLMLQEALRQLDAMSDEEVADKPETVALLKVKVQALQAQIKALQSGAKAKNDKEVSKSAIKSWKDWRNAIGASVSTLNEVGDTLGGVIGDAFKAAADIGSAVIGIIDNITNMANVSLQATQGVAEGTAEAIQKAERASVILAIIQAAMKLFQILDGFLNSDKSREAWEKAVAKQAEINKMTDSVNDYRTAVLQAQQAERSWFSSTGFDNLKDSVESAEDAMTKYNDKLHQQQVEYQNEKGGKSFLGRLATVVAATGLGATGTAAVISKKKQEGNQQFGTVDAVDNLRFETQSARKGGFFKKGRDQKTVDLRTWAKQTYGTDLFGEDGMIDVEMAKNIISNYGDKLVGETKATLEALVQDAEAYNEAMEQLQEQVSDWYSPLVDNMNDALWNWLDTGEDVLDTFKESASDTFRSIAKDMTKMMLMQVVFGDLQDKLKELGVAYGKGEITAKEMFDQGLELFGGTLDKYKEVAPELQNFLTGLNDMAKEKGVDMAAGAQDQEATYGGYETMSEQTGTELSGRFSAMYIVQSQHLALAQGMAEKINGSYNILNASIGIVSDIRALQAKANDHLATIASFEANMSAVIGEHLYKIERHTRYLED